MVERIGVRHETKLSQARRFPEDWCHEEGKGHESIDQLPEVAKASAENPEQDGCREARSRDNHNTHDRGRDINKRDHSVTQKQDRHDDQCSVEKG